MTMISAITHGQIIFTSIFPDLHFRPMEASSYLTSAFGRLTGITASLWWQCLDHRESKESILQIYRLD